MSRKKLKAHTIIPQNLYVERAADRQVKEILEDMGRPGYVLVARQMGKTNLLLNAKRTYSTDSDIFAYLDVSNTFPNIEGFFRNIVDVVLEQLDDRADGLSNEILQKRENSKLLPHKEHEIELRAVLRRISGKLVICLDEIDALTKTQYCDQAFSLIRSIYFSGRANFPEFSRLTYLLSGVAEPADIIKNKEISPFNIGEKIYLDDFSRDQFNTFLSHSGLIFDDEVSDAIFEWTNGNPRLTWDLCSAVEDAILEKGQIFANDVALIVKRLYLTQFDLPPIDHIRKLVEDDKDIRSAVMAIHYQKSESISDPLRNRLYLAGICSLDSESRRLSVKNKIIESALSEDWIHQVDREKMSLEKLAQQYFDIKDYKAAARTYLELLEQTTDNVDKSLPYYYLGRCYFYTNDYVNAAEALSQQPIKKIYPSLYVDSKNILALSKFYLGEFDEATVLFEEVVANTNQAESPFEYYQAKVSYGSALLSSDGHRKAEAVEIWQEVVDFASAQTGELEPKTSWRNLNALAKTNLAQGLISLGRVAEGKRHLLDAVEISPVSIKPERLLMLAQLEEDKAGAEPYLSLAVSCVIENQLVVSLPGESSRGFSSRSCVALVKALGASGRDDPLHKLLEYLVINFDRHEVDVVEITELIAIALIESRGEKFIRLFANFVLARTGRSVRDFALRRIALAFLIIMYPEEGLKYRNDYFEALQILAYSSVPLDVAVFYVIAMQLLEVRDIDGAVQVVQLSRQLNRGGRLDNGRDLIFEYLDVLTELSRLPGPESYAKASIFIQRSKVEKSVKLPFFRKDFPATMNAVVRNEIMRRVRPHQIVRTEKKIGRNENVKVRYADGSIVSGKYKLVARDVETGNCTII